jgi:hypothetical protein
MRLLFTSFLVGLLLACPVLCRATGDGCCAGHEPMSGSPEENHSPAPSDDAANCICGGAVKASENRVHGPGLGSLPPTHGTTHSDSPWLDHSPLTTRHARGPSLPEEDGWRGSRRVHALFQHFRC